MVHLIQVVQATMGSYASQDKLFGTKTLIYI